LISGFFFESWGWQTALKKIDARVSYKDAIVSSGLSIFGKYIPGKVWIIAGRAAYIAKRYESVKEKDILSVSFIAQFVSLWVGLLFGSVALFVMEQMWIYILIVGLLWVGLTLVVFTKYPHNIMVYLYSLIFKKELKLPYIPFKDAVGIIPMYVFCWGAYSVSFFFLVNSLIEGNASIITGFSFPLAAILGIAVLFAPGGLGVRETILVGFLKLNGLTTAIATTISVVSRLWYLIGEISIFLIAIIIHKYNKSNLK
jgi:uncharacterized membrane protein YbhN (UPF0104 family)